MALDEDTHDDLIDAGLGFVDSYRALLIAQADSRIALATWFATRPWRGARAEAFAVYRAAVDREQAAAAAVSAALEAADAASDAAG